MRVSNCLRCCHEWLTRSLTRPKRCPKCKSVAWWKFRSQPRRRDNVGSFGRRRKYPVDVLQVGDTFVIEWENNSPASIRQCVHNFAKRSGRTFKLSNEIDGLRLTRMG